MLLIVIFAFARLTQLANGAAIEDKELGPFEPRDPIDKIFAVGAYVKVNWYIAQQICSYQGMTLATISSAKELSKLTDYIQNKYPEFVNDSTGSTSFWLSGTDLGLQSNWLWLSNGRPILYNKWAPGEPNNLSNREHCLEMLPNGYWNDADCSKLKYFVCENRCPLSSYDVPLYK